MSGDVNFDNVIKQCCLDQENEYCDRVAQFLKELMTAWIIIIII